MNNGWKKLKLPNSIVCLNVVVHHWVSIFNFFLFLYLHSVDAFEDATSASSNMHLFAGAITWGNEPEYLKDGTTDTTLSSDHSSLKRAFTAAKSLTPT